MKSKILDAAIKEFSEKGYHSASTNIIHKNAGVSKGAIFTHFQSKAELFYQAFKYCTEAVILEYQKNTFSKIYDFFERLTAITFWKLEYFSKCPHIYRVITLAISESPPEIKEKINVELQKFLDLSGDLFFSKVDRERFSDDYSEEEIFFFFRIALEGLQTYYLKQELSFESFNRNKSLGLKFIKTVLKGMEK